MEAMMKTSKDAEYLYKEWRAGRTGSRIEDDAIQRIIGSSRVAPNTEAYLDILYAISDTILSAWEAGWDAAGGDDDS